MNDEREPEGQSDEPTADEELTEEIRDASAPETDGDTDSPWAPRASSVPVPETAVPPGTDRPEATAVLPPLSPSLMPPLNPPSQPVPSGPPPAAHPASPAHHAQSSRSGPANWVLVALIALAVGLGGGFLGALGYDKANDDDSTVSVSPTQGTLEDSDLRADAPLKAPGSVADVANAVLPSTVQILADYNAKSAGATGSGWVMDKNGHVITNNHVIADAAEDGGDIIVIDHERNRYEATVVGRSTAYDLAVLYLEDGKKLPPAKLGSSAKLQVGEPVVALGSPLNLPNTVTSGIVSYLHRPVTTGTAADSSFIDAVQTDAAINPGNSGGPLVNLKGEVVGVNSAIATAGGGSFDSEAGNIGVGFAIPVEQVRVTADQILKTGKAQRPLMGAQVQTGGLPDGDGALIDEVNRDSPAEEAGLKKGDRVTHVNGTRVADGLSLIVLLSTYQPDQTVELTIKRNGDEKKLQVTLEGEDA